MIISYIILITLLGIAKGASLLLLSIFTIFISLRGKPYISCFLHIQSILNYYISFSLRHSLNYDTVSKISMFDNQEKEISLMSSNKTLDSSSIVSYYLLYRHLFYTEKVCVDVIVGLQET